MNKFNCNDCNDNVLCGLHRCRIINCRMPVRNVGSRLNFYCHNHMRCGLEIGTNGPCRGCLRIYIDSHEIEEKTQIPETEDIKARFLDEP